VERRQIAVPSSKRTVAALFLDQRKPAWDGRTSPRAVLADWITAGENPYFARAAVNRLWGQLFGIGIVEPVDDFHDDNLPSHPELLSDMARAFVEARFDIHYITRAICRSQAYQRTSARTDASQDDARLLARMPVKGLSGEQLFDSLALAIGYRERKEEQGAFGRRAGSPREQFLVQFALQGRPSEPETSILQALTLMNGSFLNEATSVERSATLTAVCEMPGIKTGQRIEALYLTTLSRQPTDGERQRLLSYVGKADRSAQSRRLADVFWVLLNSAEFRLNH